jgi:hypothetical protein
MKQESRQGKRQKIGKRHGYDRRYVREMSGNIMRRKSGRMNSGYNRSADLHLRLGGYWTLGPLTNLCRNNPRKRPHGLVDSIDFQNYLAEIRIDLDSSRDGRLQ